MNSMMLIAATHITLRGLDQTVLAMAFDAGASRRSDDSRMHGPGGQHHPVSRAQLEAFAIALQHKRDRSVDAVEDLLVTVAVGGITVARPVRPRVAAGGLGLQLCHQVLERLHEAILRLDR